MKSTGVGGQAVMEGVMMKNKEHYAVAVRKPNNEIEIKVDVYKNAIGLEAFTKLPFIRGVFNFLDSMILGLKTLTYSASFFEEEEEQKPSITEKVVNKIVKKEAAEKIVMGLTITFSLVMAVLIFMLLPYGITQLFSKQIDSYLVLSIIEGVIRVAIFVGYVALISLMKDIQRVFMYHGAEHKCINCIEHGMELNVENVRKSSRQHKRCGTSFMLIVMLISILFFMFIRVDAPLLRLVYRILLLPVIAGVSYEFIRLAGQSENYFVKAFSMPGIWLQNLTTREPDDNMIEVGIASVNAVYDWKEYLRENFDWKEKKE
ncbi:DUF1385 domain-containing protein [Anaerosacchariphilus polymeriproducens]|uniref:DUF1385 domain-containing protein n=1 Tax=Anaerosacchariphilus polymeriproducens TaxID=1812858 RepID=A0A371AUZ2_9FIRM|nr:DUF1385 domain-containing protein [Anaerosacchariphilus polymeriproducens]RDU23352.1 DUF1385 domain-containing protein [Anaerosacchariphilus polymeriproducens]